MTKSERTEAEAWLTGLDDITAAEILRASVAARTEAGIIAPAEIAAHEAGTASRRMRAPVSIYTALAAAGHGRLLSAVAQNPPMGGAIRVLVSSVVQYAFRHGVAITDVGVRGARVVDAMPPGFRAELYPAPAHDRSREPSALDPDDMWEVFCRHQDRLARAVAAPGVVQALVALVSALEWYAVRYDRPKDRVGVNESDPAWAPYCAPTGNGQTEELLMPFAYF